MNSYMPKAQEIERKWLIIDATDKVLGRLATEVASILRGKHKPTFAPHVDTGDFVIVINADKVRLTGRKLQQKKHYYHTGYPGGLREIRYSDMMVNKPEMAVRLAVKGMLPKNRLGRQMYKKLKVYAGNEHNHQAQQPEIHEF